MMNNLKQEQRIGFFVEPKYSPFSALPSKKCEANTKSSKAEKIMFFSSAVLLDILDEPGRFSRKKRFTR